MPVIPVAAAPAPAPPAVAPRASFGAHLASHAAARPAVPQPPPAVAALEAVERARARLDAVLAQARAGRTFTAAELIGLQADAYRYAQTIDLAAKVVEAGAQSVKQALNTQL